MSVTSTISGIALAAVVLLSGCASNSRVALDCTQANGKTIAVVSTFGEAASCTNTLVQTVRGRLANHERMVDAARVATVVGTLGATVAAVYKAHRDTIVGLGLLGGAGYAYGNLYAPAPFVAIYNAGIDAAVCTAAVARQAAGTAQSIKQTEAALDDSVAKLGPILRANPHAAPAAVGAATAAIANAQNVKGVAAGVLAQEAHFASGIVNIAEEIGNAIDQQIVMNTPTLQAFRDASQSALTFAQSMVPASVPAPAPAGTPPAAKAAPGAAPPSPEEIDRQTKVVQAATQVVVANTSRLEAVMKAFGSPDATACAARAKNVGIKPLALVPAPAGDEIALDKDGTFSVTAMGGQPSYHWSWVGTVPPATDLVVTQTGDTFKIEAKSVLKDQYVLGIRDSGPGSSIKQLRIKKK